MRIPEHGDLFEGKYRIDRLLGEGGFGIVFAATRLETGRTVAVKILKPGSAGYDPTNAARFLREVRVVANLQSPNTLTLYDYGRTDDGLLFMVSEYVAGEDLGQLLREGRRFTEDETTRVLVGALRSLSEAHGAGVLHRDIKPDNIRVFDYAGNPLNVKVLDFGIAKSFIQPGPAVTAAGRVVGTPRYMALEQLVGDPLTPASDIYSLGLVAAEMLFGQSITENATAREIQIDGPELSGPLRAVLGRMVAREVGERYQAASDVITDLRALRKPAPDLTAEVTTDARPQRLPTLAADRKPRRQAVVGGVLVTALLCAGGLMVAAPEAPQSPAPARSRANPLIVAGAQPSLSAVVDPEPDARVSAGGCGRAAPFIGEGVLGGVAQSGWRTYVPRGYDSNQAHPVVVLLHEAWGDPVSMLEFSGFKPVADEHQFIVIAPPMVARWEGDAAVRYVRLVVDTAVEELCVDADRLYAVGQSQGALCAERLTCEPWIAAAAGNSYRRRRAARPIDCDVDHRAPFLMLSPLKSRYEPVDGGRPCGTSSARMSLAEAERYWHERNGCELEPLLTYEESGSTCWRWPCEVPFESCHVNGGHQWPGGPKRLGDLLQCDGPSADFPMAERIWAFFSTH